MQKMKSENSTYHSSLLSLLIESILHLFTLKCNDSTRKEDLLFSVKNDSFPGEKKGSRKYWFLVYSIIYEIQFTLSAPRHLHEIQCPYSLCKMFVKQKFSIYFTHLNATLNIIFLLLFNIVDK